MNGEKWYGDDRLNIVVRGPSVVRVRDIAKEFDMSPNEAGRRLIIMGLSIVEKNKEHFELRIPSLERKYLK